MSVEVMPELVEERLLRACDVAQMLDVSQHVVLDWAQAGKIPSFKLAGKAVRFRASEVLAWIEAQRRNTVAAEDGVDKNRGRTYGSRDNGNAPARRTPPGAGHEEYSLMSDAESHSSGAVA
jgi:excisionase family DNA binding protein